MVCNPKKQGTTRNTLIHDEILMTVTSLELVWLQNVGFLKLDLYLSAHATHKGDFLFLSQNPRFNLAPAIILGL
jgi:hypothetical protein